MMMNRVRLRLLLVLFHLLCLASGNISSSRSPLPGSITLPGATGSGPFDVVSEWATAFQAIYPEAAFTVTSVGSGAAQRALWGDVDCRSDSTTAIPALCENDQDDENSLEAATPVRTIWGMGDAPFADSVYTQQSQYQLQQFPAAAGAVVIAHSLKIITTTASTTDSEQEEDDLHLTYDALAAIFRGDIRFWDDVAIQATNPQYKLPHRPITVIVRADSSGQTDILTKSIQFHVNGTNSNINSNNDAWPDSAVGKLPQWPLTNDFLSLDQYDPYNVCTKNMTSTSDIFDPTFLEDDDDLMALVDHYAVDGTDSVGLALLRIPYAIGYLEFGRYQDGFNQVLSDIHLSCTFGQFVPASEDSIRATMEVTSLDPITLQSELSHATAPGGYAAAGWAYWYLGKDASAFDSCYQAWLLVQFIKWAYTDTQAVQIAKRNGWITPPQSIVEIALERLNDVQCRNEDGVVVNVVDYLPEPYQIDYHYLGGVRIFSVVMGAIVMACSLAFIGWVICYRHTRVVRASQPVFLALVCVGTAAIGAAIIPLGIDDGVTNSDGASVACMAWAWLVPCGFSISFAALFSKLWRLNRLIQGAASFKRLKITTKDVLLPLVVILSLNLIFLTGWTIVDPLKWVRVMDGEFDSYGECEAEGEQWKGFFSAILVVNISALVAALREAYKARNISDEFSESVYIGFAILSMLQALVIGVPIAMLVDDDPEARLFAYTGVLFVLSMSLLLLIFIPKMLYLRQEKHNLNKSNKSSSDNSVSGMRVRQGMDSNDSNHSPTEQAAASYMGSSNKAYYSTLGTVSMSSENTPKANQRLRSIDEVPEPSDATDIAANGHAPETENAATKQPSVLARAAERNLEATSERKSFNGSSSSMSCLSSSIAPLPEEFVKEHNEPEVRVEDLPPELMNWWFRNAMS